MDFIQIVNRIFIDKKNYNEISDEDKINSFFIINRKFGKKYPNISSKFNHKNIDKASAMDLWFDFFKNVNKIPSWYWDPKDRNKNNKISKKDNYNDIKEKEELSDLEIKYLEKYYKDYLKNEIKKLNKFE